MYNFLTTGDLHLLSCATQKRALLFQLAVVGSSSLALQIVFYKAAAIQADTEAVILVCLLDSM